MGTFSRPRSYAGCRSKNSRIRSSRRDDLAAFGMRIAAGRLTPCAEKCLHQRAAFVFTHAGDNVEPMIVTGQLGAFHR